MKQKTGRSAKGVVINLIVTLLVGFLYFYFELPAINLHSVSFYTFFLVLAVTYCLCAVLTGGIYHADDGHAFWKQLKANCAVPLAVGVLLLLIYAVGGLLSSELLRSGSYQKLMEVHTGDFTTDIKEVDFDQIPLLDRDSAEKLGNRKLGELADMVSQFEVADDYAQINYQGRPVRVTPLVYGDLFKWLNNRSNGLPAYLIIDMVTQNVEVVRLPEGMKYSTCEHFGRNVERYLRFRYPTFLFDAPSFEIDEQGVPYWVCPRVVKTIGLFGGTDIRGAVLLNAVTGESAYYEEVPTWVDRVYSADLLIQQYDYYGTYKNGLLNSFFGQKGVTVTTSGYNYIAMNDDVYVYTGITSVGGDESNVGFILSNQRTKETTYYAIAGAEEYSAMSSAEGVVQHLSYTSTFPLLLNVEGQPTYFMALKDNAGLVKMYAMVNVQQYQLVATGTSVGECEKAYIALCKNNNLNVNGGSAVAEQQTVTGTVAEVRSVVVEGTTWFYIRLENGRVYYRISAADAMEAVLLDVGDSVTIVYDPAEGADVLNALGLTF